MQEDAVKISATFTRCHIADEKFGFYNTTTGKIKARLDLKWSIDCRRTIRKKQLKAIEPTFL